MRAKCFTWLFAAASIFLIMSAPKAAMAAAVDLIVQHSPSGDNQFATIQAAIDHAQSVLTTTPTANNSFRILIQADPVPYNGPISPISNVPITGTETARTFITGGGAGPAITISGKTTISISNLTFLTAETGISVSNSESIKITNNVFQVGLGGTAVLVRSSATTELFNNTFFANQTAIDTDADILITNNIFSSNPKAIASPATLNLTRTTYNDYHNPNQIPQSEPFSIPNINALNPDPLFVDPSNHDFHLLPGSPAHAYGGGNAGNPNYPNAGNVDTFDMGAYGGPNRDTIPMPVNGVVAAVSTLPASSSITVNWNVNKSYQVSGYRVYHQSTPDAFTGAQSTGPLSFLSVPQVASGDTASAALTGLLPTTAPPTATTIVSLSPKNEALAVSWLRSSNDATGYKIYYKLATDPSPLASAPFVTVDGGATTSHLLTGLQNGVRYDVAVSAIARTELFIAVTAVNNAGGPFQPGKNNESAFSSVQHVTIGESQESALSEPKTDFPEAVAPYPDLKNEGCFIATAAFGFYSAPQVQVLRQFRDRYLMTHAAGRAFVAWYYRYGPAGANFINAHPWLKPPVRLALLPLIAAASFLVYLPPLAKLATMMILILAIFLYRVIRQVQRKMPNQSGGVC